MGVWLPVTALAQIAPDITAHQAARESDTGYAAVSTHAEATEVVPIALPPTRGGLPLPFSVMNMGTRVGAAGLGWDVPLSYALVRVSSSERRPSPKTLKASERVEVNIGGQLMSLVLNGTKTAWVGRRGNTQFELRRSGDGIMRAYDGEGNTYDFSAQGTTAGSRLFGGQFYLLRAITGRGNNRAEFGYDIVSSSDGGAGLSINVRSISYNVHPLQRGCYKHRALLTYSSRRATPLAIELFDGHVRVQDQTLTQVSIRSLEACSISEKIIADYDFTYQPDVDTGLPRLVSVSMSGQQGTPERNVMLPVAKYDYGHVIDSTAREIIFQYSETAGPAAVAGRSHYRYGIAFSAETGVAPQMLIDLTGDGRPELLNASAGEEWIYSNVAGSRPVEFSLSHSRPVSHWSTYRTPIIRSVKDSGGAGTTKITEDLRQFIDMNGDGRVDYVVSNPGATTGTPDENPATQPKWTIALNTPDPNDPSKIKWVERTVWVRNVDVALGGAGGTTSGVPLSRKVTVAESDHAWCWRSQGGGWQRLFGSGGLCGVSPIPPSARRRTFVEWELRDVNGDGYPDFVYNASRVRRESEYARHMPTRIPSQDGEIAWTTAPADLAGSRDIKALINTAGLAIEDRQSQEFGQEIFSAPIILEVGGTDGCGVARWDTAPGNQTNGMVDHICGIQDVNGDGIPDRVRTTNGVTFAKIGTGDSSRPFLVGLTIQLPGPLSRSETDLVPDGSSDRYKPRTCTNADSTFVVDTTRSLRDVTGDGIPDYISVEVVPSGNHWKVAVGTGTGYTSAVPIVFGGDFHDRVSPSREINLCYERLDPQERGEYSWNASGLYDLDGDGQPEIVAMDPQGQTWRVLHLQPAVQQMDVGARVTSAPWAGRLIRIDNGYGAITNLGYRSAKDDPFTSHAVPGKEIVLAATEVRKATGELLLAPTYYAYGKSEQHYDPMVDRFVPSGYRRSVTLQSETSARGTASIHETYGVEPFTTGMTVAQRFGRYALAGSIKSHTILSGNVGQSAWNLLAIDLRTDPRRTSGEEYVWEVRMLPSGSTPAAHQRCEDLMYPYDVAASRANALSTEDDVCRHRGFVYQQRGVAWNGKPGTENALASPRAMQTSEQILVIDDYGRAIERRSHNDLSRSDDDVCATTVYAVPHGTGARVLNAIASTTATNCNGRELQHETFEYDTAANGTKLPAGHVASGFLTASTRRRIDLSTGTPVDPQRPEVQGMNITYSQAGQPVALHGVRDDGANRTTVISYDPFELTPISRVVSGRNADGTNVATQTTNIAVDNTTMRVKNVTDPNGATVGVRYDGFGRPVLSTVVGMSGVETALSTTSYLGFGVTESGGRRIVSKRFVDAVSVNAASASMGRIATRYMDELGRSVRTMVNLGVDYDDRTMAVGHALYDTLGRVRFTADPYSSGESVLTTYGTTWFYHDDGRIACMMRGVGLQSNPVFDTRQEAFPTCHDYEVVNHQEHVTTWGPSSFDTDSAQAMVRTVDTYSAIGRLLERQNRNNDSSLGRMGFAYDAMGNLIEIKRWIMPSTPVASASTTTIRWSYDSLGRQLSRTPSSGSERLFRYDSWGNLVDVKWRERSGSLQGDYQVIREFDAHNRLTRIDERVNGTPDPSTVIQYSYDIGQNTLSPAILGTNTLGRLAKAVSATQETRFAYDRLGRVSARVHVDLATPGNKIYAEKQVFHSNGMLEKLTLLTPDTAYREEEASFSYDSRGSLRKAIYRDGVTVSLFDAGAINDIDMLGRLRSGRFGATNYAATYASQGRQMLSYLKVSSAAPLADSREIEFAPLGQQESGGQFDAMGRELIRRESRNGIHSDIMKRSYDAIGRLQISGRVPAGSTSAQVERTFDYDDLGNITKQIDAESSGAVGSVAISYGSTDLDRMCGIAFGGPNPSPPGNCNINHDDTGNVIAMPTRQGVVRQLSYTPGGRTRAITQGDARATFRYGAFGELQQLEVTGGPEDIRHDKHFGAIFSERLEGGSAVLTRTIALPGVRATRHGPTGQWTFAFGDGRGTRWVTDQTGVFVQEIDYRPFGEVREASGAVSGSTNYTTAQWNSGDLLKVFGIVQLGARLYDPAIGRFLSRDPLLIPRTAATTNPYAFAWNDPINFTDPTGLDPDDLEPGDQTRPQCEGCRGHEIIRIFSDSPGLIYDNLTNRAISYVRLVRPGYNVGPSGQGSGPKVFGPPSHKPIYGPQDPGISVLPPEPEVEPEPLSYCETSGCPLLMANPKPLNKWEVDVELLDTIGGKPGDIADYTEWFAEQVSRASGARTLKTIASTVGLVTDIAQVAGAGVQAARKPDGYHTTKLIWSVVDVGLMSLGPGGWAASWYWNQLFGLISGEIPGKILTPAEREQARARLERRGW